MDIKKAHALSIGWVGAIWLAPMLGVWLSPPPFDHTKLIYHANKL